MNKKIEKYFEEYLLNQEIKIDSLDLIIPAYWQRKGGPGAFYYTEVLKVFDLPELFSDIKSSLGNNAAIESFFSPSSIAVVNLAKDYSPKFVEIWRNMYDENIDNEYWIKVLEQNVLRYIEEVQEEISVNSMFKLLFAVTQYEKFVKEGIFLNTKKEVYDELKERYPRLAKAFYKAWKENNYSELREIAKEVYEKDLPDEFNEKLKIKRYTYSTYIEF